MEVKWNFKPLSINLKTRKNTRKWEVKLTIFFSFSFGNIFYIQSKKLIFIKKKKKALFSINKK